MTPLGKYIWLLQLLQGSEGMTFESINERWLKDRRFTEDENMPILKRTFHNHIKAIREEYGIHIECGSGYKYFIADSEKEVAPKVELLSALNLLSEAVTDSKLNKSIYVEEYFDIFRNSIVMTVLDSIKTNHKVRLARFRQANKPDKYIALNVVPFQLHYICSRWYLIGQTDEFGLMRIPLDYYTRGGARKEDTTYQYPQNYSATEYCKMLYGNTNERIHLTIRIWGHPKRFYFNKIPLMPFQKDVECVNRIEKIAEMKSLVYKYTTITFELPKSPFALLVLKQRLEKYTYELLDDQDPFSLFTEEQYEEAMSTPIIL